MSHESKGKSKVKDLAELKKVAEAMGLKVVDEHQLHDNYIDIEDCEFVLATQDGGGRLAICKADVEGEYEVRMDNYYNPICEIAGQSGALLTREYMTEKVKEETLLLGGVIASQEVDAEGYVYLEVHTP